MDKQEKNMKTKNEEKKRLPYAGKRIECKQFA